MIFDVSIIFKKKKSKDNFLYCYVRVYNKTSHKTKLISTGFKFLEKEVNWGGKTAKEKNTNKIKRLKGKYIKDINTESSEMNDLIENKLDKVRNDIDNSHSPHLDSEDFIVFVKSYARRLKTLKKFGTYNGYSTFIKDLKEYALSRNKSTIKFNDINKTLVLDFQDYLDEKGLKDSTIQTRMYKFKKMVEKAIDEDIFITRKNPFFRYSNRVKPTKKPILTEEELKKIINTPPLRNSIRSGYIYLDDEGYESLHPIEISRLMFLFQFFSNGMRVSDILFLRWKNFNINNETKEIKYDMFKTETTCRIGLNDHLVSILKHFVDKNDYFSAYEEQEEKCPRCGNKNLVKNGWYKHTVKRKTLKCLDCSRVFIRKRPLGKSHHFDDLIESKEIVFDHIEMGPHPDPTVQRYSNQDVYYKDRLYYNDLIKQKELDEVTLKNIEENKRKEINDRLLKYFEEGNEIVIFNSELPIEETKEIDRFYDDLRNKCISNLTVINDSLDKFKKDEFTHYINLFRRYASERPNEFVIPMLNSDDFRPYNDLHSIPEDLYLQYTTKSRRHGGLLKEVRKKLGIKTNITSHTARHTFTSILVNKNIDIYTISRSLGHSSVSITEKYLPLYDFQKINKDLESFNSEFSTDHL